MVMYDFVKEAYDIQMLLILMCDGVLLVLCYDIL